MQPRGPHLPSGQNEHVSAVTTYQGDALQLFEPEDRGSGRRDEPTVLWETSRQRRPSATLDPPTLTQMRLPSSVVPAPSRAAVAVRPQSKIEDARSSRSRGWRAVWFFASGAVCGSVLVLLVLSQMNVALPSPPQNTFIPPPPTATPVPPPPVVESSGRTTRTPAAMTETKKPARRASTSSPLPTTPIAEAAASRAAVGAQFVGSLAIDSTPANARAFVNGTQVGVTPLVLMDVPVGSRVIRLEADDHTPWSSTVRVVANQLTRVTVTLSPSR
jgi:PEGA domain